MIWQRTTETGANAMKAQGIINQNILSVFKLIGNNEYKTSYDANFAEGKLLEKIAD